MTQLQSQDPHSNSNQTQNRNQPADLNLIHRTLSNLIQSHPPSPSTPADHPPPSSISIPNPLSLIALTTHAILISHSFSLRPGSTTASIPSDPSLATDWNSILSRDQPAHSLHFNYSHHQTCLSFELTLSKIGNRISIAAIALEDDRLTNLDLSISEYVDPNDFPLNLTKEHQSSSNGFRSTTHLLDFISLLVNQILHPLLPDLIPLTTSPNQRPSHPTSSSSNSHPDTPPTTTQPPRQSNPNQTDPIYHPSSRSPLEIGRSDLDPIGTSNLHIPSLYNAPSAGMAAQSGMLVGPNHPMFNHRSHQPSGVFGGENRFLPPGAVPPGARFDPIGPGIPRPNPHQRFGFDLDPMGGLGQGLPLHHPHMGSRPPRPDFNDFRPPGSGGGGGFDHMFM